jgi:ribosomal protein S18 acetylase RimI-like enzyme
MMIATDRLRRKTGNLLSQEIPCVMRVLDESHLDEVMNLQSLIIRRLSREDMIQPFSADFMRSHLSKKGFILGILVENELVAFRNVYYPDVTEPEWNLGLDIGFSEAECRRAANLQMVCVHPLYRGNNLASKMNQQAIRIIKEQGRFDHLLATVSPYNYWNVNILLNSGFIIVGLKKKYNGKLRYIVYQNLKTPLLSLPSTDQIAGLTDFQKQETILKKGFHGFRLSEIPVAHTSMDEIHEPYPVSTIPDQYEIHFSKNPVEGIRKHE